jgi:5-methylthioadenosine/S-adenosylhomocysteine deaminase
VNFASVLKPVGQLVFNGQPQNVQWVFVAGRALMENGKVKGVNQGKLIEAAQDASDRITRIRPPPLKP